jgi:hypothetical protein
MTTTLTIEHTTSITNVECTTSITNVDCTTLNNNIECTTSNNNVGRIAPIATYNIGPKASIVINSTGLIA